MGDKAVDRAATAKAAAQIEAAHEKIFARQRALEERVNRLMITWRSNSAHAYHQAYLAFDKEYDNVKEGLDTLHGQLAHTLSRGEASEEGDSAGAQNLFNTQLG